MAKINYLINRTVLYRCIHFYFLNQADREMKISRNKLPSILGKGLHIPKEHRTNLLIELKKVGIIIDSSREWIQIKNSDPFS